MMHHDILSKEEFFGIFYAGAFSVMYILLPQKIFLQNIVLIQTVYQANKKTGKKTKTKTTPL